jgi:hypothetical protein
MTEKPEGTNGEDELIEQEEEAAAAEASRIGGRSGMEDLDEAERATAEAGGGESEGFEEAEKLLEDQAEHGEPTINPLHDPSRPEAEKNDAVYGDADEVDSTETDQDAT